MASHILPPDGCAFIKVGKNDVAIIDADLLDDLSQFKWYLALGYAVRFWSRNSVRYTESMHRRINQTPDGLVTDHINGVRLDNRRCNLRSCSHQQNLWNTDKQADTISGYKGVTKMISNGTVHFAARITVGGKRVCLGMFPTALEAAKTYESVSKELRGEFHRDLGTFS